MPYPVRKLSGIVVGVRGLPSTNFAHMANPDELHEACSKGNPDKTTARLGGILWGIGPLTGLLKGQLTGSGMLWVSPTRLVVMH